MSVTQRYVGLAAAAAFAIAGCAGTESGNVELESVRPPQAGSASVAADDVGQKAEALVVPELYSRQIIKIRGYAWEQTEPVVSPNWNHVDGYPSPEGHPRGDGKCTDHHIRSYATAAKTVGNGNCSFNGWLSPGDPHDCRAVVNLNRSAGGDNIWNGECEVKIFEVEELTRQNSCVDRCGTYSSSMRCQCDRQCEQFRDCCQDKDAVCR